MSDRYATVARTALGVAFNPMTRETFNVTATKHANAIPGFPDENCFAVEKTDEKGSVVAAWGFLSAKDCFRFLTENGTVGFDSVDMRGSPVVDERVCQGIPDGAVKVYNNVDGGNPVVYNNVDGGNPVV